MCFFDHSFAHIFCFPFYRKIHARIPRKYDVLSNCFKIKQLQLSLEEEKYFFRGTGSNDGIFSGLVPKHC